MAERKRPKNDIDQAVFSITKHARPEHSYAKQPFCAHSSPPAQGGLSEASPREEQRLLDNKPKPETLAAEVKRAGFWGALTAEIKKDGKEITANQEGKMPLPEAVNDADELVVKRTARRRSPYVLRLKPASAPGGAAAILGATAGVGRHNRKPAAGSSSFSFFFPDRGLKKKNNRAFVNFLQKPEQRARPELSVSAGMTIPAIIREWIFDFFLSVPLAALFILQALLLAVDRVFSAGAWCARQAARAIVFMVEQIVFGAIGLARAAIIIPLKIVYLVFLLILRLLTWLGSATVVLASHVLSFFKTIVFAFTLRPRYFWRRLAGFGALAFLFVGFVKLTVDTPRELRQARGRVLGAAAAAVHDLRNFSSALQSGDSAAAEESWRAANIKFSEASQSLSSVNVLARALLKLTPPGRSGANLLAAINELSAAADLIGANIGAILTGENDAVQLIKGASSSFTQAQPRLARALESLSGVDKEAVPENYREQFEAARALLPKIQEAIADFTKLSSSLAAALGEEETKRYAVLFQNNNELRPAGGFIGSLALVDIENGRITKMEIPGGGSYDFNGQLTKHVYSPKPLWLINPHWQAQDANWYPDWPTSAEKLMWFLENSGYYSLDGVIAFQATTLKDLLAVLGPVDFPEQEVSLTSDNVLREIQAAVELKYDKAENKPKQYIAQLAPKLLEKILASHSIEWLQILSLLDKEIAEKNILLYFRDRELNNQIAEQGWQSRVLGGDGDYLSVINANIGGGKTDGVISEEWRQEINIASDGTAVAELTVSREHRGNPKDFFEGATNMDFVRFYVPAGSEFVSAAGFTPPLARAFEQPEPYYQPDEELTRIEGKVLVDEATGTRINNEFGKTVFGNWLRVAPGEKITARIKYRLPFKITPPEALAKGGGYGLLMQKQAGARPAKFTVTLHYPKSWQVAWQNQAGSESLQPMGPGILEFSGSLSRDTGFAVLFGKKE